MRQHINGVVDFNSDKDINSDGNYENSGLDSVMPEAFIMHIDSLTDNREALNKNEGLFTVMPAGKWIEQAKTRPIPRMLFGEFWFQDEICILYADTNTGKSILAVQIGNSISRGEMVPGFQLEVSAQPVLYFDFELSDKQFENRYSVNFTNHYYFDQGFYRVEINPEAIFPNNITFDDYLNDSLEKTIIETKAKVVIIDNLTYLKNETEKAKDALPLMKHLKALKSKHNLSMLVLAHTPKRDLAKPITRNDLSGSKMLINFCDSAFSVGESNKDKSLRYFKQIKARNTEIIYDEENVCVCHLNKPANFLLFEFVNFGIEREHLIERTAKDLQTLTDEILTLKDKNKSLRDIGNELGISHTKVSRILKKINPLTAV